MRRLDVGVPTYMRREKLLSCIRSICEARLHCNPVAVHLHLYFSLIEELNEIKEHEAGKEWISYHLLSEEFRAGRFWNGHLEGMEADALCYLTDDVRLDPYCLTNAWNKLQEVHFDGVVGLNIENAKDGHPVKAAFGMIGRVYADRFPQRQVFCPEYGAFYCDEELEKYARSLGRFHFCEEAKLTHSHPDFTRDGADATHKHHRRHKFEDVMIHNVRVKSGFLWGRDFELVDTRGTALSNNRAGLPKS
jgi:hypothetical protein